MADLQRQSARERTGLYYRSQRRAMERIDKQIQDGRYSKQRKQTSGVYGGSGQVVVNGNRYQLEERGLALTVGEQIVIENVGRPGAAIYVPVPQANDE
jgi:hypothetical protein